MLLVAHRSPLMAEFVASLPLAAVDGTLRKRFKDEPLAGRLHMKTGLIDDVRALGGYFHARDGSSYVVVVMQNYRGVHNGPGTRSSPTLTSAVPIRYSPPGAASSLYPSQARARRMTIRKK